MSERERNTISVHYEFRHRTELIASADTQLKKRRGRPDCFSPFSVILDADIGEKIPVWKQKYFLDTNVQ